MARHPQYIPFREARSFVKTLGIRTISEWDGYCQNGKPVNIPAEPEVVYRGKGWKGWKYWFGIQVGDHTKWRNFRSARVFVRKLELKNLEDWRKYSKGDFIKKGSRPLDIPSAPHITYKQSGWKSYGDWFGTGTVANRYRKFKTFKRARAFVRNLKLKSVEEWKKYSTGKPRKLGKKPADIPGLPDKIYKNKGWTSWGDFLGSGRISNNKRRWRPFYRARKFVRSLGLKDQHEWMKYRKGSSKTKPPDDIPHNPERLYKNRGWKGYGDWLGTGRMGSVSRKFRPFYQSRTFVRSLGLKSGSEWNKYCLGEIPMLGKRPDDIPSNPYETYRNKGWKSMGDWLGTGSVAVQLRKYRSFMRARAFARKLKLKSWAEWKHFCKGKMTGRPKRPDDIPANPYVVYKFKGWVNFPDWVGKK
jgi:hypothetical protein